jgi:hypothetical protein
LGVKPPFSEEEAQADDETKGMRVSAPLCDFGSGRKALALGARGG